MAKIPILKFGESNALVYSGQKTGEDHDLPAVPKFRNTNGLPVRKPTKTKDKDETKRV